METKQNATKNQWVKDQIKEEIRKYLQTNDNENTTLHNLWDMANAVLRGKFIAIQAFLKKQDKCQKNNQTYHLKELEKEEQTKPKVSRRKEVLDQRGNKQSRDQLNNKRSIKL